MLKFEGKSVLGADPAAGRVNHKTVDPHAALDTPNFFNDVYSLAPHLLAFCEGFDTALGNWRH
jgi:hypothetical protein